MASSELMPRNYLPVLIVNIHVSREAKRNMLGMI